MMQHRTRFAGADVPVEERGFAGVLVNLSQSGVVFQQRFIDLSETLQICRIRGEFLPVLDKRADDIYAHRDRVIASRDIRHLERAVFDIFDGNRVLNLRSQFATGSARCLICLRLGSLKDS